MLQEPTLVLNRSWQVVNVTTVKRALSLLYEGAARVVCADTYATHDFDSWIDLRIAAKEPCIRTICLRIKIPEVIQLTYYDKLPPVSVTFSRKNIYKRDNYTCQYCGAKPGTQELSIDHVFPRSRGGKSEWTNCVLACVPCNKKKGNKTLKEANMKLARQPFKPKGTRALFFPILQMKKSWENFISEEYWNVELEES